MRKLDRAVAAAVLVAVAALVSCAPGSVEPPAATTTTTSLAGPGGLREVFVTGAVGYRWADEGVNAAGDTLDSANYPAGSTLSVRRFTTTVVGLPFDSVAPVTLCIRLTDGPDGPTVGAEQCRTAQGNQGFRQFPAGTFDTLSTPLLTGAHEYTVNMRIADPVSECSLPGRCAVIPVFNARINW